MLIIDQPTDHLDLESITAVNNAMSKFGGNILFSSHDYEILNTVANRIIEITPEGNIDRTCTYEEFLEYKKLIEQEKKSLGIDTPVQIGVMIEVPSAALLAEQLAAHADFFSIGTNDLTQYTLAIDRGHKTLCAQADPLHPAVLRLIDLTCQGAKKYGKPVAVCGAVAGDLQAVPLLIGLGVTELAVGAASVAPVKARVRSLNKQACAQTARQALTLTSSAEVRALVKQTFAV
jgi:phosphoenolpyruvate-protein kinase (PTS system EI component)